jgi:glyoxylase-like metal-dependent hydrolase (beta-lactamase superfamily II)
MLDENQVRTVAGKYDSNVFAMDADGGVILVDAGAPAGAVRAVAGGRPVRAVLLTHEHFDHVFYIADYLKEFDCPVYAHAETIEELRTNDLNGFLSREGEVKAPESFDNFTAITKDTDFWVGKTKIRAICAPGHSAGCVLYLIGDKIFTGDVLFASGIGRTDLMPDGEALMQGTLRKLLKIFDDPALSFETACHGHYENSTREAQRKNIFGFVD